MSSTIKDPWDKKFSSLQKLILEAIKQGEPISGHDIELYVRPKRHWIFYFFDNAHRELVTLIEWGLVIEHRVDGELRYSLRDHTGIM